MAAAHRSSSAMAVRALIPRYRTRPRRQCCRRLWFREPREDSRDQDKVARSYGAYCRLLLASSECVLTYQLGDYALCVAFGGDTTRSRWSRCFALAVTT